MMNRKIKWRVFVFFTVALATLAGCGGGSGGGDDDPDPAAGWARQAENPLIVPELTDTTLNYGPADPSVLFDAEDNLWKAWFSATLKQISSGDEAMTIMYAQSPDGIDWSAPQIAFQVAGDPAAWDHTHAETPAVIRNPDPWAPDGQKYMLWYSGANTTLAPVENRPGTFPYYRIGLAYSADGKTFTRHTPGIENKPGLVLEAGEDLFGAGLPGLFGDGLVADPEVLVRDGVYHMWFSSYAETLPDRSPLAFGIAHLTSADGVSWSAPHANPLASLARPGEAAAGQQPSVLYNSAASRYEMWFSNDSPADEATLPCTFFTVRGFWRAVSADGVTWHPDYTAYDLAYDTRYAYESLGFLTGVDVVLDNGTYRAYYTAWGTARIPDPALYLCPDQQDNLIPAVLTFNRAGLAAP